MPLLEMRRITKSFPGVRALDHVSLTLERGEILGVIGENGAGKSTLIKILGGMLTPDEGQILLDAQPVQISTVAVAKALGIAVIHQELMLAPNLDVTSNIFLGCEYTSGPWRTLERVRMQAEAQELLHSLGLDIAPTTLTGSLTTGQRQIVEICKALRRKARILVLDEPTSSLSLKETEQLLRIMEELRLQGVSMIYISHRLEEVFRIASRVTVLRDGRSIGDLAIAQATPDQLVSMMVGREVTNWFPERESHVGNCTLAVESLVVPGSATGICFKAHRGEILGFAGLVGSGRTELMQVIAGVTRPLSGEITLDAQLYAPRDVAQAIARGVYLAPEDRKHHGLVLSMSIAANITLPDLKNYRRRGHFDKHHQERTAQAAVRQLQIRPADIARKVLNISGGNQQKVVLAKWLAMNPKVLILDEPTRGIDVGAKAEIYAQIVALADRGLTILLVSSDLEELLALSDRIVVMRNRRIAATVGPGQLSREKIGYLMTSEKAVA